MLLEELADRLSFVRGEIVEDDVNLLPRRAQGDHLLEKGDELAAGVAGGGVFRGRTGEGRGGEKGRTRWGAGHLKKTKEKKKLTTNEGVEGVSHERTRLANVKA